MKKKKYIILGVLILLIIPVIILLDKDEQNKDITRNPIETHFTTIDSSFSPSSPNAITHEEVLLQSAKINNATLQKFVVKNPIDGTVRDIFLTEQPNITFENITKANWSPTNRFLFVYADYDGKRDVLFIKTDGRFTNGQYFLHSTGLYPDLTITNAQWIDTAALSLQTVDLKTHTPGNYVINFDDDTGVMMPASIYNAYYKDE